MLPNIGQPNPSVSPVIPYVPPTLPTLPTSSTVTSDFYLPYTPPRDPRLNQGPRFSRNYLFAENDRNRVGYQGNPSNYYLPLQTPSPTSTVSPVASAPLANPVDWSKVSDLYVPSGQSGNVRPPTGGSNANPTAGTTQVPPTSPGGQARPKTFRDMAREQINGKMGEGYFETFQQRMGQDPVDFYSDERNWFKFQRDAAMDFGRESPQFAQATIRAVVEEGLLHQQEVAEWQQMHGGTPIPQEQWERWYYMNRGGSAGHSSGAGDNPWGVS